MPAMILHRIAAAIGLLLWGAHCGAPALPKPQGLPADARARHDSVDAFAREVFEALRQGAPEQLLASAEALDALLTSDARLRVLQARGRPFAEDALHSFRLAWRDARYAGFCAQGARQEPADQALGLRAPGWVLERLLVASRLGHQRSAAWVEGQFVYTEQGWKTLSLRRIDPPRFGHADLDLAPCDVEGGLR